MKKETTTGKLKIVLLYCGQCVAADVDAAALPSPSERLPCSSKVRVSHLMKILDDGADAIEVVACPEEACRQMVGSVRAGKRVDYARGLLAAAGLSPEKIGISRGGHLSARDLLGFAGRRAEAIRSTGSKQEVIS